MVDDRAAGVIIRVLDDDRAVSIARAGVASRVGTDRRTDFDRGAGAGERIVDARESERATRAEAVAITRARCEGAEELRAVAQLEGIAAEELITVADGAHVERAHEVRDTDLQRAAEGRGQRRGGELAGVRREIILQHQHAEVIHRAQHGDAGDAADAAHARETQEAVRIDNDGACAERRAGGGRDLQEATADDVRTAGVGVAGAADAQHARAGLIDGESVGARHVLDHAGEVDDGTTGAAGARGDIDQRRITAGDRARETEVLRVRARRGGECRITQGEVAELEIAIRKADTVDPIVIRVHRRGRTVDDDGDAAGGGAIGAKDRGEARADTRRLEDDGAALEFEGRAVIPEGVRGIHREATRTHHEAGLGVDVRERIRTAVLIHREQGRTALDDLNRAGPVGESTGEDAGITTFEDEGARRGGGVGDDTGRTRECTDLHRTAI